MLHGLPQELAQESLQELVTMPPTRSAEIRAISSQSREFSGQTNIDHCDIWGFGNAIILGGTATQKNITNCWIHDAANPSTQGYHTDGPGYLNGTTGPNHVLIQNCTIASLGNTNAIAFQAVSSPYSYITIDNCFLSGFGYTFCIYRFAGSNNIQVTNNTFGTDLEPVFGFVYQPNTLFDAANPTNIWSNNKLRVLAGGANARKYAGQNGYYVWPDGSRHATDWVPN